MSGEHIKEVYVSLGGDHLNSHTSTGVISVGTGEITEEDVYRVLEASQAGQMNNANQRIIRTIARNFSIDEQHGIKDPVGMSGRRLEVDSHIITGNDNHIKNLERCITGAGLHVADFIPASLAAAESVLNRRQKELGVVSIDIGAGSTSLVVYEEGTPIYTSILPIGGESITNDIAIGLRVSLDTAEKLKQEYGHAIPEEVSKREEIHLKDISKVDTHSVEKHQLSLIISARLNEIFYMIKEELKYIHRDGMLPAGAIITGGAVRMPGVADIARDTLNLPVQIGFPQDIDGIVEHIDDPSYATAIGLLLYGGRHGSKSNNGASPINIKMPDFLGAFGDLFKNLLPK